MTVAVLYICTGKYSIFWEAFFTSSEQYFLPDATKTYFVFTDDTALLYRDHERVKVIYQERLGWPKDTLLRFHIFQQAGAGLASFDYIFFFNANTLFIQPLQPEDMLPGPDDDGLTVVLHPGYYNKPVSQRPFEKYRLRSNAYLRKKDRHQYFQGCLSGGTGAAYMQMVHELQQRIQEDMDHGIIAEWHDESHLNKYVTGKSPRVLPPAYAFQEGEKAPFQAVILMRDKGRFGGTGQLRQVAAKEKRSLQQRIWRKLVDVLGL